MKTPNFTVRQQSQRNPRRGQTLTEYLILTALVAIGSLGVVQVLGQNISVKLANITNAIRGEASTQYKGSEVKKDNYKVKDLGDFADGIQDNEK